MRFGMQSVVVALLAGGLGVAPATAEPAATEDFPSFDCAIPFGSASLCLRTVRIRVEALPDTNASFEFHFHETRDRGADRDEFHEATESVPLATNTSRVRSYTIELSDSAAGYTAIDRVTCTGIHQRVEGDQVIVSHRGGSACSSPTARTSRAPSSSPGSPPSA